MNTTSTANDHYQRHNESISRSPQKHPKGTTGHNNGDLETMTSRHLRQQQRELRQQQREQLRRKAIGLLDNVPSGEIPPSSADISNNRIFLAADKIACNDKKRICEEDKASIQQGVAIDCMNKSLQDDDDDDDAVEEMTMDVALKEDQKQKLLERQTIRGGALLNKKTSRIKRNIKKKQNLEERIIKNDEQRSKEDLSLAVSNMELDESFFAKLDADREAEKKEKQRRLEIGNIDQSRRRRTFVVKADGASIHNHEMMSKTADHGIQVVVMPSSSHPRVAVSAPAIVTKEPVSDVALMYSRDLLLLDGGDQLQTKHMQHVKKGGDVSVSAISSSNIHQVWKRSKKMAAFAVSKPSKQKRKSGIAAPIFVVKR